MCYSAQVWSDYKKYVRVWGADVSLKEFFRLYWDRSQGVNVRIPKAMDAAFADSVSDDEHQIRTLISEFDQQQATKLEQEIFKQKKRLADAERSLQSKITKAATESLRIATDKISKSLGKLADLRRTELKDRDSRIFPLSYAPVLIWENGRRVVKPMRYQCRLAGKPKSYDVDYNGTYNARRDNLEGFWKKQFGVTHGLIVVNAFYENVSRHRMEGRELAPGEQDQNVVLEFKPRPEQDMLVACLWSHWQRDGEPDLLSFAAITDEPTPEISAAGHDRLIVQIKPENIDAWLNPDKNDLPSIYNTLDDRPRPYYEHRMAA